MTELRTPEIPAGHPDAAEAPAGRPTLAAIVHTAHEVGEQDWLTAISEGHPPACWPVFTGGPLYRGLGPIEQRMARLAARVGALQRANAGLRDDRVGDLLAKMAARR